VDTKGPTLAAIIYTERLGDYAPFPLFRNPVWLGVNEKPAGVGLNRKYIDGLRERINPLRVGPTVLAAQHVKAIG